MWPGSVLTERLGLEWPIIQAPMAGSTTPELAAGVSNSGGLGSLGLGTSSPAAASAQLQAFGELSARALNANFFCHPDPGDVRGTGVEMRERLGSWYAARGLGSAPEPSAPFPTFGDAQVEVIQQFRPEVVSFHFGLPDERLLRAVKDTGALVWSSATTVAEARWLEERGADAVIAQGIEAGGHRGTFLGADPSLQTGLFALIPQIASVVNVPIIAAGGIANGRMIAAAFILGASAVQIGTAFLRCPEAQVHPTHLEALAAATDAVTRVTRLYSGQPARVLTNRFVEDLQDAEQLTAPYPAQFSLVGPLIQATPEAGAGDITPFWTGQSAALTREMPAADLFRTLVSETEAVRGL